MIRALHAVTGIMLLVTLVSIAGCSSRDQSTESNVPVRKTTAGNGTPTHNRAVAPVPQYTEMGSHMLNNCLVIEVSTASQDAASREAIADDVIKKHGWDGMVRVFFYEPGQTAGTDVPAHRIERNAYDGRNVSY